MIIFVLMYSLGDKMLRMETSNINKGRYGNIIYPVVFTGPAIGMSISRTFPDKVSTFIISFLAILIGFFFEMAVIPPFFRYLLIRKWGFEKIN